MPFEPPMQRPEAFLSDGTAPEPAAAEVALPPPRARRRTLVEFPAAAAAPALESLGNIGPSADPGADSDSPAQPRAGAGESAMRTMESGLPRGSASLLAPAPTATAATGIAKAFETPERPAPSGPFGTERRSPGPSLFGNQSPFPKDASAEDHGAHRSPPGGLSWNVREKPGPFGGVRPADTTSGARPRQPDWPPVKSKPSGIHAEASPRDERDDEAARTPMTLPRKRLETAPDRMTSERPSAPEHAQARRAPGESVAAQSHPPESSGARLVPDKSLLAEPTKAQPASVRPGSSGIAPQSTQVLASARTLEPAVVRLDLEEELPEPMSIVDVLRAQVDGSASREAPPELGERTVESR